MVSIEYEVKPGDTGIGIATQHNISYKDLRKANGDRDLSKIYPKERLNIPILSSQQPTKNVQTPSTKAVSNTNNAKPSSAPVIIPKTQDETKIKEGLNIIDEILDSEEYLKTSVKEENGKKFLVISRPGNDIDRPGRNGVDQLCMYKIKVKLGLNDDVIKDNNDPIRVTHRRDWSDSATFEKGSSIKIPVSEIGQKRRFCFGYGLTDIKRLQEVKEKLN